MKKTQLVLVECVSQFRTRYVVEVPLDTYTINGEVRDCAEWALDTVTMNEAVEFSQSHLGETIVSHRVLPESEVQALCDLDNDYARDWPSEKKIETFVTAWKK